MRLSFSEVLGLAKASFLALVVQVCPALIFMQDEDDSRAYVAPAWPLAEHTDEPPTQNRCVQACK